MTTSEPGVLVDTNVLVYSIDASNREKQETAIAVLGNLVENQRAFITVQVLGEFYRVVTNSRRFAAPLAPVEARERMVEFGQAIPVLASQVEHVIEGARAAAEYQMSLWDGVIWATGKAHGLTLLLTEDYIDGRLIEGVRIVNPFAINFDMALLR